MRIFVPFGFYGWGNIGDEATLNGFAQLLEQGGVRARASVGSRNPTHTGRVEPKFRYFNPSTRNVRRWWAKYWATGHAVVGGTPIMDNLGGWPLSELTPLVCAIDRWKVPFVFIGVGVENLRQPGSRQIVQEQIAPRVRHWSVRCDRDRQRLIEYNVKPEAVSVAADMAWLIEPASPDFGLTRLKKWEIDSRQPLIGVNLVNENLIFDQHPEMAQALADALDKLAEELGARIIFLANEVRDEPGFDRAPALMVIQRMKHPTRAFIAPLEYLAPRQMMSIISQCRVTISMRYHFCLFSAKQRVPFVAILRSDKVSDLCWDLDWQAKVVPPRLDAEEIYGHAMRLVRNRSAQEEFCRAAGEKMKRRAMGNLVALNALRIVP